MKTIVLLSNILIAPLSFGLDGAKEAVGILEGKREVLVKAKAQGEVTALMVKEGQVVQKGEVLGTLESKQQEIERNLALQEFKDAKDDYNKTKKLKKYVSGDEIQKKKAIFLKKKSVYEV